MSRISQLAVAKRSVTLLLAAALFVAGISAWGSLKQELLPDIELPVITVVASYPGTGAPGVADEVAAPIERAISGVPRLENLHSTSANSVTLVVAQFSFGTDVKETVANVERQVGQVALPEGSDPQVTSFDFNNQPVIIATIGCATGLRASGGALGVGRATRTAVIQSFLLIIIVGYYLTSFFYS